MDDTSPMQSAFALTERCPHFTFATLCVNGSHVRVVAGQIYEVSPLSRESRTIEVCEAVGITPCDRSCTTPQTEGAWRSDLLKRLPRELPPSVVARLHAYEVHSRPSIVESDAAPALVPR